MRSLLQLLVGLSLLVSQVVTPPRLAATALSASANSSSGITPKVTFNTNTIDAVAYISTPRPDFDKEVLDPLRTAQAQAAAKAAAAKVAAAKAARIAASKPATVAQIVINITGDPVAWMTAAGVNPSDFGYVDFIVNHESGWNGVTRWNYSGSGAYGLFQALPGSKMAAYGADWQTNPVTQIRWAQAYAIGCYGSWYGAYRHWLAYHSW